MIALLFLTGSALLGSGLVRLATGRLLNHAEQALWGLVVGWTISTVAAYLMARALGDLTLALILALTALVWAASIVLWFGSLRRLRLRSRNIRSLWRPGYAGLLLLLLLFGPIFFELFRTRMLQKGAGGRFSGGGSTWFDINLHLAISTSFLYGRNYPPVYTPFPPAPLVYPFLPDFQTALLVRSGLDFHSALTVTGVALALAIVGLFYSLAQRIAQTPLQNLGARVQWSASLATILFLLNGGLGFLYFFRDWRLSGKSLPDFWSHMQSNYAHLAGEGIRWANLISDGLLPQRPMLFGLPLALICITLFAVVWQESVRGGRWSGWRSLLGAGLLAGVLPFFHVHSYIAVGLIGSVLFLLRPRRVWLVFFAPSILLALPQLIPLMGHAGQQGFFRLHPVWRGADATGWPIYWLRNIGLPLLLIFPAYFTAPAEWRRFYLAFVALLLFGLLVHVSPNDFDNIKLIYYWYAMTCVLIAGWLVRLAAVHRRRVAVAALLFIVSIATGVLALQYERLDRKLLFSDEELSAAAFAREHTAPRSLFLTAPAFNQAVLCLAGRAVVRANTDWLWSHGYAFQEREADVKAIYAGEAEARDLLRYYGVEYVYLGQKERDDLRANESFFEQNFAAVFRSDHITIYDTRSPAESAARPSMSARGVTAAPAPPREFASRIGKDPYQWLVEFPRAGYAVYRYYRVAFGRRPLYREMIEDMRAAGRGVYVGAAGWEQALEDNKAALAEAMSGRADFKSLYDSQTNAQYVDALYENAGVQPSTRERSETIAALDARAQTRAAMLQRIADNGQLYRKEYNAAYVLVHYFGYLRRDPEGAPDGELAGFNFWLGNLNRTGDYRSLSRAFLESVEYKDQLKKGAGNISRP
ncbi:MAG TPA: hypothetical protein VF544_09885 [Pyrinomonadaceae bacterium]|jgi:hypothetical protein